jgi:putative endonuclease
VSSSPTARRDAGRRSAGPRGEALAAAYLTQHGLAIVERNFRTRFGEIDLIARDGATLVFVEVRMRSSPHFGGAGESITAAKRARLVAAARGYLATVRGDPPCRFDAILMQRLDGDAIDWRRDILAVDR